MSDRKYRQRGYQDDDRDRRPKGEKKPVPPKERAPGRVLQDERGPKTPNLMAAHEVFRCARCGNLLSLSVGRLDSCAKCRVDLHSCVQCLSFDTSERWECTQSAQLQARVAPKDERNNCAMFAPRTTVERQTGSPSGGGGGGSSSGGGTGGSSASNSARRAFDDLFK